MSEDERNGECQHDLFPVAMDYESEFLVLECAECGERFWRNLHFLEPDLDPDGGDFPADYEIDPEGV